MANIIEIVLKGTDKLSAPFTKPIETINDLEKSSAALAKTVGLMGVGVAAAFAKTTQSAISSAASFERMSEGTGIAASGLSKMAYSAQLANADMGQVVSMMKFLNKSLIEAAQDGSGEAGKAFTSLGISIRDAGGNLKTSGQIANEVAFRFENMESGAQKAALAQKLLGKAGTESISFLNQYARDLKSGVLETKGFSDETTRMADELGDNFDKLKYNAAGVGRKLAEELVPHLLDFSKRLLESEASAVAMATAAKTLADTVLILAAGMETLGAAASVTLSILDKGTLALFHQLYGNTEESKRVIDSFWKDAENRSTLAASRIEKLTSGIGLVAAINGQPVSAAGKDSRPESLTPLPFEPTSRGQQNQASFAAEIKQEETIAKLREELLIATSDGITKIDLQNDAAFRKRTEQIESSGATGMEYLELLRLADEERFAATSNHLQEIATQRHRDFEDEQKLNFEIFEAEKAKAAELLEIHKQGLDFKASLDAAAREADVEASIALIESNRAREIFDMESRQQLIAQYANLAIQSHASIWSFASNAAQGFSSGLSNAFSGLLQGALTLSQAVKQFGAAMLKTVTDYIAGWIAANITRVALNAVFGAKVAATNAVLAATLASAWAPAASLASVATFGGAAAAGTAGLLANFAVAKGIAIGGQAHAGLDFVPSESTFLLQRGERVIQPAANEDLTNFLRNQRGDSGGGQSVIQLVLDGDIIGRVLGRLSDDGRLTINERAIVTA